MKYAVKKSLHKCIRVLTDISVKQCVNIDIITAKKDVQFKKKKITYTYTTLALSEINEKPKLSPPKKRLNIKKEYQRKSKKMCFIGISY